MKKRNEPSFYEELTSISIHDLSKEYREDSYLFENEECDEALDYKEFYECKFEKMIFSNHIRRAMFTDVIFENCDFSNVDMRECVFHRVIMNKCRLTGTDLTQGVFDSFLLKNSHAQYVNFSSSKIKDSSLIQNVLSDSGFTMCKVNNLELDDCDFSRAEFYDTSLDGLDFSTSDITDITLDMNHMKGIILNEEQALACAKLLGIKIKS